MTDRIKQITDLIDDALPDPGQHSPESDQYSDVAPEMPDAGTCWRCEAPAAEDSTSGLCDGCRAFLLEDSENDPAPTTVDERQATNRMQWERPSQTQVDYLQIALAELATECFEAIEEPRDLTIRITNREYELLVTSTACPEQYTVLRNDEQVGYLRLRGGRFRVDCPTCGDTTIGHVDYYNHGWIGAFDPADRARYLTAAVHAIDRWERNHRSTARRRRVRLELPCSVAMCGVEVETENGVEVFPISAGELSVDAWINRWRIDDVLGNPHDGYYQVSTMFSPINLGFNDPLWYQTRVLDPNGSTINEVTTRYVTREQATVGHQIACENVRVRLR